MLCRRYLPYSDLKPWLAYCWEWRCNTHRTTPEIFPGTGAEIIFNLGGSFSIESVYLQGLSQHFLVNPGAVILLSPRRTFLRFSTCEGMHIFSLRLRSAACFEMFSVPLEHICDRILHLWELGAFPPAVELVYNHGSTLLGQWMRQQLAQQPRQESALLQPIEMLYQGLPYTQFQQLLNLNLRTLQRRLHCYLGVDARYFQRTARFQKTLRRLMSGGELLHSLLDEGYYDQPHFNKNCKFYTKRSPGKLLTPDQFTLNHYNPKIGEFSGFI